EDGLAVLGGDQLGDLIGPLGEPPGDVGERLRTHVDGQRGGLAGDRVGGGDGLLHLGVGRDGDPADLATVVGVGHGELAVPGGGAACEPEGTHVHASDVMPGATPGIYTR